MRRALLFESAAPVAAADVGAGYGRKGIHHYRLQDLGTGPSRDRPDSFLERSPLIAEAQVLRTVAHELRSPLTALVTSAELLTEDFDSLEVSQKREIAASMHRGALWLHTLVENLLCDAAMREGRFHLNRQVVPVADIVTDVEPIVAPLLKRRTQQLNFESDHTVPEVIADPRRIGQVLVNLLSNASKYSPENSTIEVSLAAKGSYVRATVADRGPGVPKGDESRLFESFYRTAAAHRSGQAGTGLGLSIVKTIVEAHMGRYGVENRTDGGACFWFELPTAAALTPGEDEPDREMEERLR